MKEHNLINMTEFEYKALKRINMYYFNQQSLKELFGINIALLYKKTAQIVTKYRTKAEIPADVLNQYADAYNKASLLRQKMEEKKQECEAKGLPHKMSDQKKQQDDEPPQKIETIHRVLYKNDATGLEIIESRRQRVDNPLDNPFKELHYLAGFPQVNKKKAESIVNCNRKKSRVAKWK